MSETYTGLIERIQYNPLVILNLGSKHDEQKIVDKRQLWVYQAPISSKINQRNK